MGREEELTTREELLNAFSSQVDERKSNPNEVRIRTFMEVNIWGRIYLCSDRGIVVNVKDSESFKVRDMHDLMMHSAATAANDIIRDVADIVKNEIGEFDEPTAEDEGNP